MILWETIFCIFIDNCLPIANIIELQLFGTARILKENYQWLFSCNILLKASSLLPWTLPLNTFLIRFWPYQIVNSRNSTAFKFSLLSLDLMPLFQILILSFTLLLMHVLTVALPSTENLKWVPDQWVLIIFYQPIN